MAETITSGGSTITNKFAYEGGNQIYADMNSTGTITTLYDNGMGNGTLYGRIQSGTIYWIGQDYQGSVRDIFNAAGSSDLDAITYEGDGLLNSQTGAQYLGNYAYTGLRYDSLTTFYVALDRWYNTATVQWLQLDPIGVQGGLSNFRSYVGDDWTNDTDLNGLQALMRPPVGTRLPPPAYFPPTPNSPSSGPQPNTPTIILPIGAGPAMDMQGQPIPGRYVDAYGFYHDIPQPPTSRLPVPFQPQFPGKPPVSAAQTPTRKIPPEYFTLRREALRLQSIAQKETNPQQATAKFAEAEALIKKANDLLVQPAPAKAAENAACFVAGTPLLTPDGFKAIEKFVPGDLVLSKPEQDPEGKCEWKAVEEVFTNFLPIWELHVGDQIIRTSAEHPFYVVGLGWLAAAMLQSGHLLLTHDGRTLPVKTIINTGEEKPVYNIRVADFHTYFVGCDEWGFSVWAHNACLVHYTTQAGLAGILASKTILASTGTVNARYGDGQYFTDILPTQVTDRNAADISDAEKAAGIISIYQLSRSLYGMPFNTSKVQYYVIVDVTDLNVSADAPHIYHVPNTAPLDVSKRIVSSGKTLP